MLKQVYTLRQAAEGYEPSGLVEWHLLKLVDEDYTLGEREIDTPIPETLKAPKWDGKGWVEYEPDKPLPPGPERIPPITFADYLHTEAQSPFDENVMDPAGTLKGFYASDVHTDIPETAVSISKEMWEFILNNQGIYRFDPEMIADKAPGVEVSLEALKALLGLKDFQLEQLNQRTSTLYQLMNNLKNPPKPVPPPYEEDIDPEDTTGGETQEPEEDKKPDFNPEEEAAKLQAQIDILQKMSFALEESMQDIVVPTVIDSQDFLVELPPVYVDPDTLPLDPMEVRHRIEALDETVDIVSEACLELFENDIQHNEAIDVTQEALMEALLKIEELEKKVAALEGA